VETDINALLDKVKLRKNIDFSGYKKSSIKRRIARRCELTKAASLEEYLRFLENEPEEYDKLIETLLIKETGFFRDREVFDEIRKTVLPGILAYKRPGEPLRIWCPGCATGEEAYSIAMLLIEELGPDLSEYQLKLYATDLSNKALQTARRGRYTPDKLKALPQELKKKYFEKKRVTEELRRKVIFGRHNLVSDPPISNIDLLLCRYVLIYFTFKLQRKVFEKLHYALRKGGFLVLGKSEALPKAMETLFDEVSPTLRIYRKI
jgi:two-component system CheB/CheR fusion protein